MRCYNDSSWLLTLAKIAIKKGEGFMIFSGAAAIPVAVGHLKINFLIFQDPANNSYIDYLKQNNATHNHLNAEFHYIYSGSCNFAIEDKTYAVKKGDFLIIPPLVYHGVLKEGLDVDFRQHTFYFYFDEPCSHAEAHAQKIFNDCIKSHHFFPDVSPKIHTYCAQIVEEEIKNTHDRFAVCQALFSLITIEMLRITKINPESIYQSAGTQNNEVYKVYIDDFFNRFYQSNIKIQDLADILKFSVRHTSTVLNKLYGTSFTQKLIQKRLSVAKNLLIYTDLSITQICFDCGFQKHSFFNSCFRKQYGSTPSEFRKANRAKTKNASSADGDQNEYTPLEGPTESES